MRNYFYLYGLHHHAVSLSFAFPALSGLNEWTLEESVMLSQLVDSDVQHIGECKTHILLTLNCCILENIKEWVAVGISYGDVCNKCVLARQKHWCRVLGWCVIVLHKFTSTCCIGQWFEMCPLENRNQAQWLQPRVSWCKYMTLSLLLLWVRVWTHKKAKLFFTCDFTCET